ncbi:unnamed protein product, partial [Ilex paraguariensis]
MQSLCGRVRLVARHTFSTSKVVDFNLTRAILISSGRGLSSLESNFFASNGVAAANNFYGYSTSYLAEYLSPLLPKFASCSGLAL